MAAYAVRDLAEYWPWRSRANKKDPKGPRTDPEWGGAGPKMAGEYPTPTVSMPGDTGPGGCLSQSGRAPFWRSSAVSGRSGHTPRQFRSTLQLLPEPDSGGKRKQTGERGAQTWSDWMCRNPRILMRGAAPLHTLRAACCLLRAQPTIKKKSPARGIGWV